MSDEKDLRPAKRGRKGGPGRPVGLTPHIQQIICDAIAAGNYQKVAAQAADISEDTLMKWRARGRRGVEPYATLEKAIEQADRDCEMTLVSKVMGATDKDWRAAAMMLERKYPERWSRVREQTAGADAVAVAFAININLDPDPAWQKQRDEQVEQRRPELARRSGTTYPAIDVTPTPPPDRDPDPNLN
jgi:hypothetical protein